MALASPILQNFNTGEFSPLLDGRIGFEKYPNGCSILENFLPTTQGPLVRRGGTRFVGEVKNSADRVLLIPFEYSVDQSYIMEFGNLYVRFYSVDSLTGERGIIESSPGVPYELVTPFSSADLYNTDGTVRIDYTQSGDFLYLVHPDYLPRILVRLTATTFQFRDFYTLGGPLQDLNDTTVTMYASAATGLAVTVTASVPMFSLADVGGLIYLESKDVNSIKAWEVGKSVLLNDERRSDGKTYKALNAGTTGTNRPVHNEGALFDGDNGVQWEYQDSGSGVVRVTGYISPTQLQTDVEQTLPSQAVGIANATTRWALGEFSPRNGWPTAICFYRERLWLGRGQKVFSSVSGDFTDFSAKTFGQITADMGMIVTLVSGKINDLQWMSPDRDLVVGTAGGEFGIGELTNGEPLGPTNRRCRILSEFGSRSVNPVKNGKSLLFANRSGLKARETFYEFTSDGYESTDATVLAEHVTATGIVQMAFAPDPDQIVWTIRADGRLIGFTWNNEQNVRGWHPHKIGGDGFVESIAVIPAAEGDRSELWMLVRRTINGQTKRYIEYMKRAYRTGDAQSSQFYLDSGLTYSGTPADTITGLDHLEGETVSVLTDGAPHPDQIVTGGSIQLQLNSSVVQVGLSCPARYRSMRIEAGSQNGTSQGKKKRIHKMILRLFQTGGGKYGSLSPDGVMDDLIFRSISAPMDQPAPLFSGDITVQWPDGYRTDCFVGYQIDQPVAATIVALMPQVDTSDSV